MSYFITAKNGARIYQPSWMRNPGSTRKRMNAAAVSSTTGSNLISAGVDRTAGSVTLYTQIAATRVQAEANAKLAAQNQTLLDALA